MGAFFEDFDSSIRNLSKIPPALLIKKGGGDMLKGFGSGTYLFVLLGFFESLAQIG